MSRKIRANYTNALSETGLDFSESKIMTKQSFRDESNINNIIDKWRATGHVPRINSMSPTYGDFTNVDSYLNSVLRVQEIDEQFAALPSAIRDRMANDPANLLRFLQDDNNIEEAISLGIIQKPPVAPPEPPPKEPQAITVPTGTQTPAPPAP